MNDFVGILEYCVPILFFVAIVFIFSFALKYETKINKEDNYFKNFKISEKSEIIKQIYDIRKFEIELYWKRATYFWTMIGSIFAGYALIYTKKEELGVNLDRLIFSLLCLGLLFSFAWYFVNRGSKFWLENWEEHLKIWEKEIYGISLYDTILVKKTSNSNFIFFKNLLDNFPFSVSKVNQYINLLLIFFWFFLIIQFLISKKYTFTIKHADYYITFLIISFFILIVFMFKYTLSNHKSEIKYIKDVKAKPTVLNYINRDNNKDIEIEVKDTVKFINNHGPLMVVIEILYYNNKIKCKYYNGREFKESYFDADTLILIKKHKPKS